MVQKFSTFDWNIFPHPFGHIKFIFSGLVRNFFAWRSIFLQFTKNSAINNISNYGPGFTDTDRENVKYLNCHMQTRRHTLVNSNY